MKSYTANYQRIVGDAQKGFQALFVKADGSPWASPVPVAVNSYPQIARTQPGWYRAVISEAGELVELEQLPPRGENGQGRAQLPARDQPRAQSLPLETYKSAEIMANVILKTWIDKHGDLPDILVVSDYVRRMLSALRNPPKAPSMPAQAAAPPPPPQPAVAPLAPPTGPSTASDIPPEYADYSRAGQDFDDEIPF